MIYYIEEYMFIIISMRDIKDLYNKTSLLMSDMFWDTLLINKKVQDILYT
jgi:hypothetical protein